MVLVFDLDDTLYNEVTFVYSGFQAVADFLAHGFRVPAEESYLYMVGRLKQGRGTIFDDMLLHFGVYSKSTVNKCLQVYRSHKPQITLNEDAKECLKRFANCSIYIVTDGNKLVQKNKLFSLGLYNRVKFCYITHRYGVKHSKPSPYCFMKICEREKVAPSEVVYIGDNPHKDFVNIKALGFKTIRIMQGHYKDVVKSAEYEADWKIESLDELTEDFFKNII